MYVAGYCLKGFSPFGSISYLLVDVISKIILFIIEYSYELGIWISNFHFVCNDPT